MPQRSAADHLHGLPSDLQDAAALGRQGYHRGLVQHDPLAHDVDEDVGCTQINANPASKHGTNLLVEAHNRLEKLVPNSQGGVYPVPIHDNFSPLGPASVYKKIICQSK